MGPLGIVALSAPSAEGKFMIDRQEVRVYLDQAVAYQAKADYENAEKSMLLALEAATQLYNDPGLVADALKQLTAFYSQMDQYNEAIAQAGWAIEIVKKRLGADNPALEALYLNMADLQRCEGNDVESEKFEKLAVAVRK
jgi:tetratricopeptide (TPR) repeat protein